MVENGQDRAPGGGAAATEGTILDAALAEALEHGIRRTTASDVARRAGVSRQTLYRYWPDIQALLAALVTRELFAVMLTGERAEAASLPELAERLVDTAWRIRSLPLVERLRQSDPELLARYILERLGTSQRGIHRELVETIRSGQARGFVRAGDADAMSAMLLLMIQSAIQSAPLVVEWLPESAWRRELAIAITGYIAPATT